MRLHVRHVTHYAYSAPVFLEPHVFRLKPPTNSTQQQVHFDLALDPAPAGRSENTDLGGNETVTAWFNGLTDHLTITTESTVETLRPNPYDYLWDGPHELPLYYPDSALSVLGPYREIGFLDPSLQDLIVDVNTLANGDAQQVPAVLTSHLYERIGKVIRASGEPLTPEETLRRREASCRDTAVLYLAVARALGFAGRFVSGYFAAAIETNDYELHAWAELYIPGGGWRGFDPTAGLAVADRHIALAYAAQSHEASPVQGTYRGRATASMTSDVSITL
jgi:transglutaminase-like putative cysteine protease